MNTLQKIGFRLSLGIAGMMSAAQAFANNATGDFLGEVPDIGGQGNIDIRVTVLEILGQVLMFMALVAVVFIVIAGIRLVVSQGEEGEKDKAKKTIVYVIIGLVVIVLASAIVNFVIDVLTT